ncbi:MAG: hypothetical protein ACXU9U_05920, partial [Parachlamydiaceae bacterium]
DATSNQQLSAPQEGAPYQLATNLPLPPDIARVKRIFTALEEGQSPSTASEDYKKRKFSHEGRGESVQPSFYFSESPKDASDPLESLSVENDAVPRLSKVSVMPPPTPLKAKKGLTRGGIIVAKQSFSSPFEELFKKVETLGKLNIYGVEATLTPFKAGTYLQAYTVAAAEAIWPDVENDQLLVKLYHGRKTFFNRKLPARLANSLTNYQDAQKLNLPVATIYNDLTAETDRYFLVEKLSHLFDIHNKNHMQQVRHFMKISLESQIPFDLSYNNFGVRDEIVCLWDYNEKVIPENKLHVFVIQYLKTWVKQISLENLSSSIKQQRELSYKFLSELTESLDVHGFKNEWVPEAIDGQLPLDGGER